MVWLSKKYIYAIYFKSPACVINGMCYDDGTVNPNKDCEICNTTRSSTSWKVKVITSVHLIHCICCNFAGAVEGLGLSNK